MNRSCRQLMKNESGIILATVIIISLVLSLVAVSLMQINVSQFKTGRSVVDSIKAEQLSVGKFYQYQQRRIESC